MFKHMDNNMILGVDIGGSHIASALINFETGEVLPDSYINNPVPSDENAGLILETWEQTLRSTLNTHSHTLAGIAVAMPGPFDYENGVSKMEGVNKYEQLYGVNIEQSIKNRLGITNGLPVLFENDASCFGLGESLLLDKGINKIIAITLGTGFGATFIQNNRILKSGSTVPQHGHLYNSPYLNGIAEDYISGNWLLKTYTERTSQKVESVKQLVELARKNDSNALTIFKEFGVHLASCLQPHIQRFGAECLVIGGSISKSADLFLPFTIAYLNNQGIDMNIKVSDQLELSALTGAASLIKEKIEAKNLPKKQWRLSSQPLLPLPLSINKDNDNYNTYPVFSLGENKINRGYQSMASWIAKHKAVVIDGYVGNDWHYIRETLSGFFVQNNIQVLWYEANAFMKTASEIETMVLPYMGQEKSLWGRKTTLQMLDFFIAEKINNLKPCPKHQVTIIIGTGAALAGWDAPVIFVDLPKNEIQYRMRAGSITNLGCEEAGVPAAMYKRFYFVDWVVLNAYREAITDKIALVADGQWKHDITWAAYETVKKGLDQMSKNVIRVRPWFEAGAWGGQWMKKHIPMLNQEEVNYAWSFELIVPENGLLLESDQNVLEVAFDWLMQHQSANILGNDESTFGTEFPIRFDFLDTYKGGNLSIQCHPSKQYIQAEFGETITQDETYYILDCEKGAGVYLGFQDNIDAEEFRKVLENSALKNEPIEMEQYVQLLPANKHDLYLIPNGTVHSAGKNNLVLEISATPYIFTFKMYDWLRPDLNGEPRPLNIHHAFRNLNFNRKGNQVQEELVSKPTTLKKEENFQLIHLPTHEEHFYDVYRVEFTNQVSLKTEGKCHVMMLVEGKQVILETANGIRQRFSFAETFIVPAAADSYTLINEGEGTLKIVRAFIK